MMKATPLTDKLATLSALRDQPLTNDTRQRVCSALTDKNNLIVAAAAKVAKKHHLTEAIEEMRLAYERFLVNPVKTDKLCHAKFALLDTLDEVGFSDDSVYLQAAAYRQLEPAYGGSVDTAVKLRVRAGQALSRTGCREVFFVMTAMLMDPEPEARSGAARILSGLVDERSELLLRMKVLAGDKKSETIGDCFTALMSLDTGRSMSFVAGYLDDRNDEIAGEAALALGESRIPQAFALLSERFGYTTNAERRQVLVAAVSLLRSDEAADFLLAIVADHRPEEALVALDALRGYRDRDAVVARLRAVVAGRGDPRMTARMASML